MSQNTTEAGVGLTRVELWINLVVFYGLMASLSCIGNTAMAIGIIKRKGLRSRFFAILTFLLIIRTVMDVQLFVMFIQRTLRTVHLVNTNITRFSCILIHFQAYYAMTVEMVLLLGLVIDKSLAIIFYAYYRTLTYKQALQACTIAIIITMLIKLGPSFFGIDFMEIKPCINGWNPLANWAQLFQQNIDLFLSILIFVVYISLIIYVRFRLVPYVTAHSNRTGDYSRLTAFKQQAKVLPLLKRLVLLHCGLTLLGKVFMTISGLMPTHIGLRFVAYSGMILALDHFSNLVILMMGNKDIRKATVWCITKEVTPVQNPSASVHRNTVAKERIRSVNVDMVSHS